MTVSPEILHERIIQALLDAGAAAAGVAFARRIEEPPAVQAWFLAQNHAGMQYLEAYRELERDPANILAGVRSIVCAAFAHPVCPPGSPPPAIAGYALGEDYHTRVRRALQSVAEKLNEWTPCRTRVCVDAIPLPERFWAQEAGVGFMAVNGCLIVPGVGPNVVLGELLTDAEVAPDEPLRRRCVQCNRCIRFCPTGALSAAGGVNANLCLSYWTTQARGEAPPQVQEKLDGRFWGCETCVSVCPHVHPSFVRDFSTETRAQIQQDGFWKQPPWRTSVFGGQPRWKLERNRRLALSGIRGETPE